LGIYNLNRTKIKGDFLMMNIIKRAIRIVITGYIVKAIRNLISGKSNGGK